MRNFRADSDKRTLRSRFGDPWSSPAVILCRNCGSRVGFYPVPPNNNERGFGLDDLILIQLTRVLILHFMN